MFKSFVGKHYRNGMQVDMSWNVLVRSGNKVGLLNKWF